MDNPPDPTLLDTIGQLKQQETQWRRVGELLHRLLSQLAGQAHDASLDATLDDLRQVVRSPAEPSRIPALLGALARAVKALDAPAAAEAGADVPAAGPATPALDALLLAVLDRLQPDEALGAELDALRRRIAGCHDAPALREHGKALAALVSARLRQLAEDRRAAVRLLQQINSQLGTLTDGLDQADAVWREEAATRSATGEQLLDEVQALDDGLQLAADLASLRGEAQARLATIRRHLASLGEREQAREQQWLHQVDRLRKHVQQLEQNTQQMEAMLEAKGHLVDTDALTGLANRRALQARMVGLCEPGRNVTSLLMLDIDHFKSINDRLGHGAGDRALRIVAEQLLAALRPGDFLARYGGEEFVAILAADGGEAMQIAERLRERLERTHFRSQHEPVHLTLSCGVTTVQPGDTPDSVLERADRALYQAKHAGRNRCVAL